MLYRDFGKTGYKVSAIGFGGAAVSGAEGGYGFGSIEEHTADELIEKAVEAGINLFDSAPIYGFGASERRLGRALKKYRDKVFVVTKSGVTWDGDNDKQSYISNRPEVTERMLHQSLKDLDMDYVDLYMVHWPDPEVDIRKPLEIITKAQAAGKIKHIGLCNTFVGDLDKARSVAEIAVVQSQYNFFERSVEKELFPYLEQHNIGFMSYGTLDKGILSGRVKANRTFEQTDVRAKAPWWTDVDHSAKFAAAENIAAMAAEEGHSMIEVALGFVLKNPVSSTALVGTRNLDQLTSMVAAVNHLPSVELLRKLEINSLTGTNNI